MSFKTNNRNRKFLSLLFLDLNGFIRCKYYITLFFIIHISRIKFHHLQFIKKSQNSSFFSHSLPWKNPNFRLKKSIIQGNGSLLFFKKQMDIVHFSQFVVLFNFIHVLFNYYLFPFCINLFFFLLLQAMHVILTIYMTCILLCQIFTFFATSSVWVSCWIYIWATILTPLY